MARSKQTAVPKPDPAIYKKVRRYNGPVKGSDEAKERMAKVRAAQYAKNNLVYQQGGAHA